MSSDNDSLKDAEILSDAEPNDFIDNVAGENNEENTEVQRDENADDENQDGQPVKVKRIIRNPQPKLNAETLKGPRGIASIPSYFERVKFKGKGHEHQDLNAIMKTYEYWCHRLFPKFPFDTCIERLEKLGSKKPVQTHIKKIRFDLLTEFEDKPIIDSSDEEVNVEGLVDTNNDQINQQFDNLLQNQQPEPQPELTADQLEIIKINKARAEKLRQERLRNIRDKAELNLEVSEEVSSQVATTSGINDWQNSQSSQEVDDIEPLEVPVFDLESNIKGKASVKGSTIKKASKKLINGEKPSKKLFDLNTESSINDQSSEDEVSSKNKRRPVIESDSDGDVPMEATSNLTEELGKNVLDRDENGLGMATNESPLNKENSERNSFVKNTRSDLDSDDSNHDMVIDEDASQENIPTASDKIVESSSSEKGTLLADEGHLENILENNISAVKGSQIEDENVDFSESINSVVNDKLINNLSGEVNSENKENSSVDNIS